MLKNKLPAIIFITIISGMAAFCIGNSFAQPGGEGFIEREDKNKDGKVARDEFGGPADHFDALDINKDGFLDSSEAPEGRSPGGDDGISINNDGYANKEQGPVNFSHQKHIHHDVGCLDCHHTMSKDDVPSEYPPEDTAEFDMCADCHSPVAGENETLGLKQAFHDQCVNCHVKVNEQGGKHTPVMEDCESCHSAE